MGVKMKIITIIPAYNEEASIKNVVKETLPYSDVMVVDDGSSDQTFKESEEAGAWVIKHEKNQGKGAAIKTGFKKALDNDYDILLLMDGDGQHDPRFIPDLISEMDNADIVIGSRFKGINPHKMPLQRKLSNKLTTQIIKFVTGYHISDSQSGFRAFSNTAAKISLEIPYDDYVFESEVLYQASRNNLKIKEKQISCKYDSEQSYITGINILRYILFVFKLMLRKFKTSSY
jgi:glycosyltransferase involved in cell wall biosynthesis